jgi:hypothetical protein
MTCEDWVAALKLSTMWEFWEVRQRVIEEMPKLHLEPLRQLFLGKEHNVLVWLERGFRGLIQRDEAMTAEEVSGCAQTLGWATTAGILRLRDYFGRLDTALKGLPKYKPKGAKTVVPPKPSIEQAIRKEFEAEFKALVDPSPVIRKKRKVIERIYCSDSD